jgi:hypothetical protein
MGALTGDFTKQPLIARYLASTPRVAFWLFSFATGAIMLWAWWVRDYHYVRAESGVGYALGIVGASLMTILLLYPLRKRLRFMQSWLNITSWFRLHMVLGVLGPLCILLHSNFQLGSTNSTVALTCMLLVAGSGLIGRYLYGKFHYGLYGQQVGLQQLKADLDSIYKTLEQECLQDQQKQQLQALHLGCDKIIASQRQTVSLRQLISQRRWLRKTARQILPAMSRGAAAGSSHQVLVEHQRALAALLDKLAGLRLFERLFGLWHVVHIPVFLLMVVTAIVHIFVVHWY